MGKSTDQPGLKPIRSFPYFKLQFRDDKVSAWKDIQVKFTDRGELLKYVKSHVAKELCLRIVVVEDRKSRRVLENLGRTEDLVWHDASPDHKNNSGAGT